MTPQERKNLAEQITANPLFRDILDSMETGAIEALISASDDKTRLDRQIKVQAIRQFRSDVMECLQVREPRAAPA